MRGKLGIFASVLAIFLCIFSIALASEAAPVSPNPTPSPTVYALPYPGLLPGHPLYFLKLLRDRILLFLISNPVRQVEFRILLADKRLNSAIYLIDQDKPELGVRIAGEAVAYLEEAEKLLFEIPAGTPEINNIKDRFEKSWAIHREIISGYLTRVPETEQIQLTKILKDIEAINSDYTRKK